MSVSRQVRDAEAVMVCLKRALKLANAAQQQVRLLSPCMQRVQNKCSLAPGEQAWQGMASNVDGKACPHRSPAKPSDWVSDAVTLLACQELPK